MSNKTRYTKYASAMASATAMISAASAATITYGAFDNDPSADSIVSTSGTLHQAVNLVSHNSVAAGATVTVNGVTFTGANLFSNNYNFGSGVSTGATGLDILMGTTGYNGAIADTTISGLTIGNQYQIQLFYGDNRGCCNGRIMAVGTTSASVTTSGSDANDGTVVTGTFTADATTQTFFSSHGVHTLSEVSAFQVRDVTPVPEPSSAALLGLGGLALALRRRK